MQVVFGFVCRKCCPIYTWSPAKRLFPDFTFYFTLKWKEFAFIIRYSCFLKAAVIATKLLTNKHILLQAGQSHLLEDFPYWCKWSKWCQSLIWAIKRGDVFPHMIWRLDTQKGKWLLSRHCQEVSNQNRVNTVFGIAFYPLLQRRAVSSQMPWYSLGHMWIWKLPPAEKLSWLMERRLWLQLVKCQLGTCNFWRITSSKHDFFIKKFSTS